MVKYVFSIFIISLQSNGLCVHDTIALDLYIVILEDYTFFVSLWALGIIKNVINFGRITFFVSLWALGIIKYVYLFLNV